MNEQRSRNYAIDIICEKMIKTVEYISLTGNVESVIDLVTFTL